MRHFYVDSNQKKRKYGIFAPGIDRFILIDPADYWMVLETAEILSSKIPTMAYMLPTLDFELTNGNCLEYTIEDKTQQKIGPSQISIGRQNPGLKFLFDHSKIIHVGQPEDFKSEEKQEILQRLVDYAKYVQKRVYAINLTEAIFNSYNNKGFITKYLKEEWYSGFRTKADRSDTPNGVFVEIRNALYMADSREDAEKRIIDIWLQHHHDQEFLIYGFYRILDEEMPEALKPYGTFRVDTIQQFVI